MWLIKLKFTIVVFESASLRSSSSSSFYFAYIEFVIYFFFEFFVFFWFIYNMELWHLYQALVHAFKIIFGFVQAERKIEWKRKMKKKRRRKNKIIVQLENEEKKFICELFISFSLIKKKFLFIQIFWFSSLIRKIDRKRK